MWHRRPTNVGVLNPGDLVMVKYTGSYHVVTEVKPQGEHDPADLVYFVPPMRDGADCNWSDNLFVPVKTR